MNFGDQCAKVTDWVDADKGEMARMDGYGGQQFRWEMPQYEDGQLIGHGFSNPRSYRHLRRSPVACSVIWVSVGSMRLWAPGDQYPLTCRGVGAAPCRATLQACRCWVLLWYMVYTAYPPCRQPPCLPLPASYDRRDWLSSIPDEVVVEVSDLCSDWSSRQSHSSLPWPAYKLQSARRDSSVHNEPSTQLSRLNKSRLNVVLCRGIHQHPDDLFTLLVPVRDIFSFWRLPWNTFYREVWGLVLVSGSSFVLALSDTSRQHTAIHHGGPRAAQAEVMTLPVAIGIVCTDPSWFLHCLQLPKKWEEKVYIYFSVLKYSFVKFVSFVSHESLRDVIQVTFENFIADDSAYTVFFNLFC